MRKLLNLRMALFFLVWLLLGVGVTILTGEGSGHGGDEHGGEQTEAVSH